MPTNILGEIAVKIIPDIFLRVAKIAVASVEEPAEVFCDDMISLVTSTQGDYRLRITMYSHKYMFNAICKNMKCSTRLDSEDIQVYAGEFFNILCGQIVSSFNRQTKKSAFFSIPTVVSGYFNVKINSSANDNTFWYKSNFGIVKFVLNLSAS